MKVLSSSSAGAVLFMYCFTPRVRSSLLMYYCFRFNNSFLFLLFGSSTSSLLQYLYQVENGMVCIQKLSPMTPNNWRKRIRTYRISQGYFVNSSCEQWWILVPKTKCQHPSQEWSLISDSRQCSDPVQPVEPKKS
jgi:hypothetical protein